MITMEDDLKIIENIKKYLEDKEQLGLDSCYFITKKLNEEYWDEISEEDYTEESDELEDTEDVAEDTDEEIQADESEEDLPEFKDIDESSIKKKIKIKKPKIKPITKDVVESGIGAI